MEKEEKRALDRVIDKAKYDGMRLKPGERPQGELPSKPEVAPVSASPITIVGEGPTSVTGRQALTTLTDGYGKVNELAHSISDKALLAEGVQPFVEKAISSTGRALETMYAQRDRLATEINGIVNAKRTNTFHAEIRAHFKASEGQGLKLLKPFSIGDKDVISAVMTAPPFLSGLTDEQFSTLKVQATLALCPEKKEQLVAADKAIDQVKKARDSFTQTMAGHLREWQNKDDAVIEEMLK